MTSQQQLQLLQLLLLLLVILLYRQIIDLFFTQVYVPLFISKTSYIAVDIFYVSFIFTLINRYKFKNVYAIIQSTFNQELYCKAGIVEKYASRMLFYTYYTWMFDWLFWSGILR